MSKLPARMEGRRQTDFDWAAGVAGGYLQETDGRAGGEDVKTASEESWEDWSARLGKPKTKENAVEYVLGPLLEAVRQKKKVENDDATQS